MPPTTDGIQVYALRNSDAQQMAEMLEAFSTAADKSMGLDDFERMMVAAKLP